MIICASARLSSLDPGKFRSSRSRKIGTTPVYRYFTPRNLCPLQRRRRWLSVWPTSDDVGQTLSHRLLTSGQLIRRLNTPESELNQSRAIWGDLGRPQYHVLCVLNDTPARIGIPNLNGRRLTSDPVKDPTFGL